MSITRTDLNDMPAKTDIGSLTRHECDYAYLHITDRAAIESFMRHPMRMEGLSIVLSLRGQVTVDMDTSTVTVEPNTLLCLTKGKVLSLREISTEDYEACVFIVSDAFLESLNFDVNVISSVTFDPDRLPVLPMSQGDMELLRRYFDLMRYNTVENADPVFVKGISRNLFAAAVYQVLQLVNKYEGEREPEQTENVSRSHHYVREFMRLVQAHHRYHRCVSYYAEKLFLSPKYLSHIIKKATSRSAAEWIDHFVILEAKNLLRYSGKNIQQVAYELNFTNQSSFGKYFKHLTGMSPTQFLKS